MPTQPAYDYPTFFSVDQFASMTGLSKSHLQHAAGNYTNPGRSTSRAKMPAGWAAFHWSGILIICSEDDLCRTKKFFAIPD
jgi:hypothetical protein